MVFQQGTFLEALHLCRPNDLFRIWANWYIYFSHEIPPRGFVVRAASGLPPVGGSCFFYFGPFTNPPVALPPPIRLYPMLVSSPDPTTTNPFNLSPGFIPLYAVVAHDTLPVGPCIAVHPFGLPATWTFSVCKITVVIIAVESPLRARYLYFTALPSFSGFPTSSIPESFILGSGFSIASLPSAR